MTQSDPEMKQVVKEALKEWLDEKFTNFGKWTAVSILAAALCAAVYFIFWLEIMKNNGGAK